MITVEIGQISKISKIGQKVTFSKYPNFHYFGEYSAQKWNWANFSYNIDSEASKMGSLMGVKIHFGGNLGGALAKSSFSK